MATNEVASGMSTVGESARKGGFFGHPRGVGYIVFTEAWERFSFYGMQGLLVLYMAGYLFQAEAAQNVVGFETMRATIEAVTGPLSPQALATQVFGIYIGLVYFVPVFGGLLGDRVLGRTRAVLLGAAAMALGHFLLAFEASFVFALLAIITGSGLLKGNLAAQVGALYERDDPRRDAGYSLYVVSINVGATIAPLVCGTLGEIYGWHYGFGAAGVGMLVGIVVYLKGRAHLPADELAKDRGQDRHLRAGEGRIVWTIVVVLAITALFWTAQTQVWNTYPLWVRDRVDRAVLDATVPVTWFQSLDTLAVLLFAPVVLWLWRRQRAAGSEPGDLGKLAIGCLIFACACAWLSGAEWASGGEAVAIGWPLLFHGICAWGYLYVGPVALALVSRAAPLSVNAMMVGAYYVAIFVGSIASGWLGRFYETLSPAMFWAAHAAIVSTGALLLLLGRGRLARGMALDAEAGEQRAAGASVRQPA
ncbi:peptide MFS transporter [Parahaliea mediterranea]|uniref:Peptide MFS transporter n=2 Tax=Parahaliea mediterranea TaxID=651086 RepID=A0A939DES7_9GAMM|nr:peptide MFS transporter [Parahaliea mediterranea]